MKFNLFGRNFYFLAGEKQLDKAIDMIEKYILKQEFLILLMILAVYFAVRVFAKIRKKERLLNNLKKISPWIYLLIILGVTIFNRASGNREIRVAFDNWFTANGFHESNVLGFMFNAVLYMPLGYLLYKWRTFGKNAWIVVVIVFTTSILIEALQYILARGVTAVDDLLANVAGGLLGLGFAMLIHKVKKHKRESVE